MEQSLIIVGHGATDVIGSGTSGINRRVTVVIEEPSAGSWRGHRVRTDPGPTSTSPRARAYLRSELKS